MSAVAFLLFAVGNGAHATYLGDLSTTGELSGSGSVLAAGDFSQQFSFDLTSGPVNFAGLVIRWTGAESWLFNPFGGNLEGGTLGSAQALTLDQGIDTFGTTKVYWQSLTYGGVLGTGIGLDGYTMTIAGTATAPGSYGLVLTTAPVPEPESYAMFLAGIGVIGTIANRRRKKINTA